MSPQAAVSRLPWHEGSTSERFSVGKSRNMTCMSTMYCDHKFIGIILGHLSVKALARGVKMDPVMRAITAIVFTLTIQCSQQFGAIGNDTPRLQDWHSEGALMTADQTKLTAVEVTFLKSVLRPGQHLQYIVTVPIPAPPAPFNRHTCFHAMCFLEHSLKATPKLSKQT